MHLFELTHEMTQVEGKMEQWAMEHDGDITDFPLNNEMSVIEGQLDAKVADIGVWYKNILSNAKELAEEKQKLAKREQVLKNKAERLKTYLTMTVNPGYKVETSKVVIGWRKSESVEVDDPEGLPEVFQKIITTVSADKTLIKKEFKAGKEVPGAELIVKQNIQIK